MKIFKINYWDRLERGFTVGRTQCDHNEMVGKSRNGMSHTPECRARILDRLLPPKGRARIEAYKGCVDRAINERKDDGPTTTRPHVTVAVDSPDPMTNRRKRAPTQEKLAQSQEELTAAVEAATTGGCDCVIGCVFSVL